MTVQRRSGLGTMSMASEKLEAQSLLTHKLEPGIFDVDVVLLASPHERAWREALKGLAEPERFATAIYQAHVARHTRH